MGSVYGKNIRISIFGQSHSEAMGCMIDGLRPGEAVDGEAVRRFMARRAPGKDRMSSPRKEADEVEFVSGLMEDRESGLRRTCGAPLCALIRNTDTRPSDYDAIRDIPRPSHADYTAWAKYGRWHDASGGGHFSGRLTAPLCAAGAVCLQSLERMGIRIAAHILSVGDVHDARFSDTDPSAQMERLRTASFPVIDPDSEHPMRELTDRCRMEMDSIGGIVECAVIGLRPGLGGGFFDGVESRLAQMLFSIPAVKGVEFGSGFAAAAMKASEHNDPFVIKDGTIRTATNNSAGIQGGITNGMPVLFRVAIKPTPSIASPQKSVSLSRMEETVLEIRGRHDPCIALRAVPVVEAAAAVTFLDIIYDSL